MGIVFNHIGHGYKRESTWHPPISRRTGLRALTRRNIQFLRTLGLRVVGGRKQPVWYFAVAGFEEALSVQSPVVFDVRNTLRDSLALGRLKVEGWLRHPSTTVMRFVYLFNIRTSYPHEVRYTCVEDWPNRMELPSYRPISWTTLSLIYLRKSATRSTR